jgi:hypothetical protein
MVGKKTPTGEARSRRDQQEVRLGDLFYAATHQNSAKSQSPEEQTETNTTLPG